MSYSWMRVLDSRFLELCMRLCGIIDLNRARTLKVVCTPFTKTFLLCSSFSAVCRVGMTGHLKVVQPQRS